VSVKNFRYSLQKKVSPSLSSLPTFENSQQSWGITDINHIKTKSHQDYLKLAEANKCNVFTTNYNNAIIVIVIVSLG